LGNDAGLEELHRLADLGIVGEVLRVELRRLGRGGGRGRIGHLGDRRVAGQEGDLVGLPQLRLQRLLEERQVPWRDEGGDLVPEVRRQGDLERVAAQVDEAGRPDARRLEGPLLGEAGDRLGPRRRRIGLAGAGTGAAAIGAGTGAGAETGIGAETGAAAGAGVGIGAGAVVAWLRPGAVVGAGAGAPPPR